MLSCFSANEHHVISPHEQVPSLTQSLFLFKHTHTFCTSACFFFFLSLFLFCSIPVVVCGSTRHHHYEGLIPAASPRESRSCLTHAAQRKQDPPFFFKLLHLHLHLPLPLPLSIAINHHLEDQQPELGQVQLHTRTPPCLSKPIREVHGPVCSPEELTSAICFDIKICCAEVIDLMPCLIWHFLTYHD
jgi:hypothetical protein